MDLDARVRTLASRQYGLASNDQIRDLGASRNQLARLVEHGEWTRASPNVLAHVASPAIDEQRLLAAVLDAGGPAAVSHETAAAWWGVPGYSLDPVQVTVVRCVNHRRGRLGVLHTATFLPDSLVAEVRGVPVTKPPLVVLDLALSLSDGRLNRLTDWFWARRLLDESGIDRTLELVGRSGKNGTAPMRELVEKRRGRYRPHESGTERRFHELLQRSGQKPMDGQVDLGNIGRWIGRVDAHDHEVKLVVEIDSELHHSALVDVEADARRDAALRSAGYTVQRFDADEVWHRGDWVAEEVARLRRELRKGQAAA